MHRSFQPIEPHSPREHLTTGVALGWAGLLLLLDQVTKAVVSARFREGEALPVIDGFFSLTYVTNKGAAWNLLEGQTWLLLAVALLVGVGAIVFIRQLAEGYAERYFAIFTLLSGVVGNSIDRIWRGAVVDFLSFTFGSYHYPVFNVADCAICAGVGVFILSSLLRKKPKPSEA